jgi:repressor LexA
MLKIGDRIRLRREQLGLTQDELAQAMGYKSRSSINKIEKGVNEPPQSIIVDIAKTLKTTPAYLMGWEDEQNNATDALNELMQKYDNIKPVTKKRFPMLGEIACGEPIFADEDREHCVMVDMDIDADFCLTAKGDSMINARINDGDIVFIKEMPLVENGEIAAVIIGDEATLKRVYYYKEQNKLVLNPENPRYEPLVYVNNELDTIRILGKAVYFMSAL